VVKEVLESLIIKHQTRQWYSAQVAAKTAKSAHIFNTKQKSCFRGSFI